AETVAALNRASPPPVWSLALVAHFNNLLFFAAVVFFAQPIFPKYMGVLSVGAALLVWIAAGRVRRLDRPARAIKRALRIDGAIMLAFFAWLQFDTRWVALILVVQAILTAMICRRLPGIWPGLYAAFLILVAGVHLVGWEYFLDELTAEWTL